MRNKVGSAQTPTISKTASNRLSLSSSPLRLPSPPRPPTPTLSRPISSPPPIPSAPIAAAADGLSKLRAPPPFPECPSRFDVAGDLLNCCGDDLGPRGEKAACACEAEKGVDTGGVAPGIPEGVRPCCEALCLIGWFGVGVAISWDQAGAPDNSMQRLLPLRLGREGWFVRLRQCRLRDGEYCGCALQLPWYDDVHFAKS